MRGFKSPQMLTGFYQYMVSFVTCSESVAAVSEQFIIDTSKAGRSRIGKRRHACSEESYTFLHFGAITSLLPLT